MTTQDDLDALLERAVELEVKTAAAEAAVRGAELTVDAREDIADQTRERLDGELDEAVIAELEARLEVIDAQLKALGIAEPVVPEAPLGEDASWDDDEPEGMDFFEPDDEVTHKALGCSQCGSSDVDELVTGSKQCGGCGWPIAEAKATQVGTAEHYQRVDDETGEVVGEASVPQDFEEPEEPAGEPEAKGVTLSEFEVLQRQRLALGE